MLLTIVQMMQIRNKVMFSKPLVLMGFKVFNHLSFQLLGGGVTGTLAPLTKLENLIGALAQEHGWQI